MVDQTKSSKSILTCYKLTDYSIESWLSEILECTNNNDYKNNLLKHGAIQQLLSYFETKKDYTIEDLKQLCSSVQQNFDFVTFCLFMWVLYQRENSIGPSVYTEYVEETRAPLVKGGPLPETPFDPISNKNEQLQEVLLKHFEKDGEPFYHKSQFLITLLALECCLERTVEGDELHFSKLMKARLSYLKDINLNSSVVHLKDESINLFDEYIKLVKKYNQDVKPCQEVLGLLLVEYSYCLLHFYKYDESADCVNEALSLCNLQIQLTGKLGKRTFYQIKDIAQLTLNFDTRAVKLNIQPSNDSYSEEFFKPDQEALDIIEHDNILYKEGPKFVEEQLQKDLSTVDIVLVTAHVNQIYRQLPNDEQREEMLRPFVLALSKETEKNWLVRSNSLIWKCRNDFLRSKTKEKSLLFMQGLIDQFRNQTVPLIVKADYGFCIAFPMKYQFQKELAQMYQDTGMFMSAYELLQEVELSEEAVRCLFIAGRQTEAMKQAEICLKKFESSPTKLQSIAYSNLLCMLGDIKRDHTIYEKAWSHSNQRCSRAMRSLARHYFFKNQFEEAITCYHKAFAINKLYPKEWFTCGCAHMKLEQWDKAIFSFGTSISIDSHDTEAWGNIANCYHAQGKMTEALACTEQALKINRRSWRLWHNCIRFSLACNQFYKAIGAVVELIRQNKLDGLNSSLLVKIAELFLQKYASEESGLSESEFLRHKTCLYTFFKDFSNHINDHNVHRLVWRIKSTLNEPPLDIKEYKLKEIRSLMHINWQVELKQCELIERAIIELHQIFESGQCEAGGEERAFIKTTAMAIEDCLKRKVKVENLVQLYSS